MQGDQVLISAIVHNNTDRDCTAMVWVDVAASHPAQRAPDASHQTGRERSAAESKDREALTPITHTIALSANSSTVVGWPIEVKALGTLTVTMRVKSDKAADAVQLSMPIELLAVPEVAAIIGDTASSVEHTIELPAHTIKEVSTLQIDLCLACAGLSDVRAGAVGPLGEWDDRGG